MRRVLWILITALIVGFAAIGAVEAAVLMDGNLEVSGSLTAASFSGSGAGLTGVQGSSLVGSSVTVDQLGAGAVTADKLQSNAVTRGKMAFYNKVAIVAASGGDYPDPASAMTAFASWCGLTPSAAEPCLLKIMPGVYTVTSAVVMQPYIDIEGDSEKNTKITGALSSGSWPPDVGVVQGANNAEVRFLTIENTATTTQRNVGLLNASASPSILYVTVNTSGSPNENYGIYNSLASSLMKNVTATATGGLNQSCGIYNYYSSPAMMNIAATGSSSTANSYGIYNDNSSSFTMTNVTANASGAGNDNMGIYNNYSSPVMTNIAATASGGAFSFGVSNYYSTPTMTNIRTTGSGGTSGNYGVRNDYSSLTMTNVTAIASGTNGYGVGNFFEGTIKINHSALKGSYLSIFVSGTAAVTQVGNTLLDGSWSVGSGTTLTCAGTYNASYTFYPDTCAP